MRKQTRRGEERDREGNGEWWWVGEGRRVECILGEGRERVEEGNLSCTVRSGTWEPSVLEGMSVHYHRVLSVWVGIGT